jgi:hypothetical protein
MGTAEAARQRRQSIPRRAVADCAPASTRSSATRSHRRALTDRFTSAIPPSVSAVKLVAHARADRANVSTVWRAIRHQRLHHDGAHPVRTCADTSPGARSNAVTASNVSTLRHRLVEHFVEHEVDFARGWRIGPAGPGSTKAGDEAYGKGGQPGRLTRPTSAVASRIRASA